MMFSVLAGRTEYVVPMTTVSSPLRRQSSTLDKEGEQEHPNCECEWV